MADCIKIFTWQGVFTHLASFGWIKTKCFGFPLTHSHHHTQPVVLMMLGLHLPGNQPEPLNHFSPIILIFFLRHIYPRVIYFKYLVQRCFHSPSRLLLSEFNHQNSKNCRLNALQCWKYRSQLGREILTKQGFHSARVGYIGPHWKSLK